MASQFKTKISCIQIALFLCMLVCGFHGQFMNMFNEEWAVNVQHVTIWLELVGFTLTFIEVLYPKIADSIEKAIDDVPIVASYFLSGNDFLTLYYRYLIVWDRKTRKLISELMPLESVEKTFSFKLTAVVVFILFGVLYVLSGFFASKLFLYTGITWLAVLTLFIFVLVGSNLAFVQIQKLIAKLNSLSDGRAIGSMGLILAFAGLLGEAYQYITMISQ